MAVHMHTYKTNQQLSNTNSFPDPAEVITIETSNGGRSQDHAMSVSGYHFRGD